MATIEALITAEEFFAIPRGDQPKELVQGRIISMTPPATRHGQVCGRVFRYLDRFAEVHNSGHVVCNDSGFITHRNPDSVRGPDVSYYGFDRIPAGPMPSTYTHVVPRLAVEVLSPSDIWRDVLEKVTEYFRAGVIIVAVFDPETKVIQVFRSDRQPQTLSGEAELRLPEVLGEEFTVPADKFFV
jgi:Uma2 family endonuclease